ncbi:universal stress protein, partial [Kineococcus indalonis]|uniref:universal stress protein n=1 Tax=Kineococcus indalonis TaxID=2696566 RepID=UPI00141365EE
MDVGTGVQPGAQAPAGGAGPDAVDGAVLVGVERGEESLPVVRWAAREAARRGAPLLLLHAEQLPVASDALGTVWVGDVADQLDREAREALERLAERAGAAAPGVRVRTRLVHEHRRHALLRASARACLVVTGPGHLAGRRGGVLGELVLGSTCLSLVAHAPCPVVVVRARAGDAEEAEGAGGPGG